jgi:flagellin-like protein
MNVKKLRFLNFPLGKKKAMSPLFSTIILIGFAIALGGVVMSWGRAGYGVEESVIVCEQTSLSLVSYGENEGICNKEGKLYFTMQNNGEVSLDGVKVSLLSNENIYSSVINQQISSADVVKLELGYPDIGEIEKVIFTPKFISSGRERLCPRNGFSTENVGEC